MPLKCSRCTYSVRSVGDLLPYTQHIENEVLPSEKSRSCTYNPLCSTTHLLTSHHRRWRRLRRAWRHIYDGAGTTSANVRERMRIPAETMLLGAIACESMINEPKIMRLSAVASQDRVRKAMKSVGSTNWLPRYRELNRAASCWPILPCDALRLGTPFCYGCSDVLDFDSELPLSRSQLSVSITAPAAA